MPERLRRRIMILAFVVWSLAWTFVSLEPQIYATMISPDRTIKEPSKTTTENPETTKTTTTSKPQPTQTTAPATSISSVEASSVAVTTKLTEASTSSTLAATTFDPIMIGIVAIAIAGGGALSVAKLRSMKKSKITKLSKLKEPTRVEQGDAAPKITIQPGHGSAGPSIGPGQGPSIGPGAETQTAPPRAGPVIPTLVPRSARTCAHCGCEIANIDLYCPSCGIKLSAEQ